MSKCYALLANYAPFPRQPHESEKHYITTTRESTICTPQRLSCWHDKWVQARVQNSVQTRRVSIPLATGPFAGPKRGSGGIESAELEMTVVIPAYNEESRLEIMLEEAVAFLDCEYGRVTRAQDPKGTMPGRRGLGGYEILLVNDGSKDSTVDVALRFSQRHALHDVLRIVSLAENRGKGGAVTHGFRHARGRYVCFADADGASRFEDLAKLVTGCDEVKDAEGRAVAIGSRAHLQDSDAVVKRSRLRNILMHLFHLILRIFTTTETAKLRDTQCGFKLFSRAALPHIVPYMHAEGWIFDVEMLMLAESSPACVPAYGGPDRQQNGGLCDSAVDGVHDDASRGSLHGNSGHTTNPPQRPNGALSRSSSSSSSFSVVSAPPPYSAGGSSHSLDAPQYEATTTTTPTPPARTKTNKGLDGKARVGKGIPVCEVPIQWKEVGGSKLNVVRDSIGMAWGLLILRAGWVAGVYRRA